MSFTTPPLFTGEPPKAAILTQPSLGSLTVARPVKQEDKAEIDHPLLDHKSIVILIGLVILLFVFWKR